MTKYRFEHTDDNGKSVLVELYEDDEHVFTADEVVGAFVQFLKGVTFEPGSIAKFIKHELV